MATTKVEFMSPEWIAMARDEITRALDGKLSGAVRYTLCEKFTNAPAHLRRGGGATIGFCVRLGDGTVEVESPPAKHADVTIISDYADALAIARNPDAAAADPEVMAQRIADGRLTIEGDPSSAPAVLQEIDIHRLLAARTA